MKNMKVFAVFCITALLMQLQQVNASIDVDYYRLPRPERVKVTQDQDAWDKFETRLLEAQFKAMQDALGKLKLDGLSEKERIAKVNVAIEKSRDPAHFNLEKDWHVIAYLLTGEATIKEENLPNEPLHNVIFGGLKTSVKAGLGPVRYFDAKLVAETAKALAGADRKIIASRYDPAVMKKLDIYSPPELDEKVPILQVIEKLTAFFQKAAATHEEVITFGW